MDESLDVVPGQPRRGVGLKGVERRQPVASQSAGCPGSIVGGRRSQGLVRIAALNVALDAARTTGCSEVAAVFGFCAGRAGASKTVAHVGGQIRREDGVSVQLGILLRRDQLECLNPESEPLSAPSE